MNMNKYGSTARHQSAEGAAVGAGALQALERARVGIPAGVDGQTCAFAQALDVALRGRAGFGREHQELRALGDRLERFLQVLAENADQEGALVVHVQALAAPL